MIALKITVINGSPRKGNTYAAARLFKNVLLSLGEVEFTEFFLSRDMPEFCTGCMSCFFKGEQTCPHAKYTLPILEALVGSDAFIFTTPVYALQASGAVKVLLDHCAFMFMPHRPRPEMFGKKAFIIVTAAGAGTRAAIKTVATSLKFWGVNRVYSSSFALRAEEWEKVDAKRMERYGRKLKRSAERFYAEVLSGKQRPPYLYARFMFYVCRGMIKNTGPGSPDKKYWSERGWFTGTPFK